MNYKEELKELFLKIERKKEIISKYYDYKDSPTSLPFPLNIDDKLFQCPNCDEMKSIWEIEIWYGDTPTELFYDQIICAECYEEEQGYDL